MIEYTTRNKKKGKEGQKKTRREREREEDKKSERERERENKKREKEKEKKLQYHKSSMIRNTDGIPETSSFSEIRSSYYRLLESMKNNYNSERKKKIVKAYTVLINKRTRRYYDYYLKYPNSVFNIIYFISYYIFKLFKVILALFIIALLICGFQYMNNKYEMKRIIQKLSKNKAFKKEVLNKIGTKHPQFRTYDLNTKRKVEEQIEEEVAQEMGLINNQRKGKFILSNLFIVKILCIPKNILCYILWNIKWIIKYTILKEEYDESDKMYITRVCMNISAQRWNNLGEEEKKGLLKKQLWIKEYQEEFLAEQREKDRLNKISSAKYKQQIRKKKKGMNFNYND
ncbi:DnaJ protein [Plasmodium brasilianum]|uniref:DnaJ protein n=1 Tax=Plasmodium brasilianum TaxID=5824 RepID=A0ACB9YA57_PLABR|nr:DnaJ protein [Plasmodium brasilianum]